MDGPDTWIEAQARLRRLARVGDTSPWKAPPLIPVAEVDDIALDPQGRFAVLLGYAGAHQVDLTTFRSTRVFSDNRTERRAGLSSDGRTLVVFDGYGPTLHVIDLQTRTVESKHGKKKSLRSQFTQRTQRPAKHAPGVRLIQGRPHIAGDPARPLRPPHGTFKSVRAVVRTPHACIAVVGTCLSAAGASEARLCLTIFSPEGMLLGVIGLAQRGQDATHIYIRGQRADPKRLAAKGIHISMDRSAEEQAAIDRFAPSSHDGTTEVAFGRLPVGFFGRLDVDRSLGDRAFGFEDPERTRLGLQGQSLPEDQITDLAADAALRWRFWQRLESRKTIQAAFKASAGLTDLLPEIQARIQDARTQKERRQHLSHAVRTLRGLDPPRRTSVFDSMLARVRTREALDRLAHLLEAKPDRLHAQLAAARSHDVEQVIAACQGASSIQLHDGVALLVLAAARLEHLAVVEFDGSPSHRGLLDWLARTDWPALRQLSAPRVRLSDAELIRLAAVPTVPRLERLELSPEVSALGQAALHFSTRNQLVLPGAHDQQLEPLLTHPELDARLREEILTTLSPQEHPGMALDAQRLPGVDLAALLRLLKPRHVPRVTLINAPIDMPLINALAEREVHLLRCHLNAYEGCQLATRSQTARWHFEACAVAPEAAVALHARLGVQGPSLTLPDDLLAFLTSETVEDRLWYTTLNRLRALPGFSMTAVLDALSVDVWRALILRRPGLGVLAGHPLACRAIAELMRAHLAGGTQTLEPFGPFEFHPTDEGWSIGVHFGPGFDMANEPTFAAMRRLFTGQDVQTGDDAFDDVARLSGNPRVILGALDAPARSACTTLLRQNATYRQGVIHGTGDLPEGLESVLNALVSWVDLRIDFARLQSRFFHEPNPGVRARLLTLLLNDPACTDAALDAVLAKGARDGAAEVRRQVAEAVWREDLQIELLDPAVLATVLPRLRGARQLDAIARIAQHGGEHCIAALTEVGTGLFVGRALKEATQSAIADITQRIGGLRTGGLSVSEAGPGDLAITSDSE